MGQFEDEFGDVGYTGDRSFKRQPPKLSTAGGPACPSCGSTGSRVIETRNHKGVIRRRRECNTPQCGRFTSFETTTDPSTIDFKLSKADKAILSSVSSLLKRLMVKFGLE